MEAGARERGVEPRRWRVVVGALVASRLGLLLVAWFARYLQSGASDAELARRGWQLFPVRLLDVWARWDSCWYLDIAQTGYLSGPLTGWNRIAFYPAYPALVGALARLVPAAWRGTGTLLAAGIVVSTVSSVVAALALHRLAQELLDEADADRAVVYLFAFPSAFYLGCLYTEALFLALAVPAFLAAREGRWARAGALGAAAALTRSTGLLLFPALAWVALERARSRDAGELRRATWLALVPAAFAAWVGYCWRLTGDPLAAVHVQAHWGKSFTSPWITFFHTRMAFAQLTPIDGVLAFGTLLAGAGMLLRARWRALGIFTVLCVASFAFTGTLLSAGRYVLCAFPIFLALARAGRSVALDRAWLALSVTLQALLFAAWARFYWVG